LFFSRDDLGPRAQNRRVQLFFRVDNRTDLVERTLTNDRGGTFAVSGFLEIANLPRTMFADQTRSFRRENDREKRFEHSASVGRRHWDTICCRRRDLTTSPGRPVETETHKLSSAHVGIFCFFLRTRRSNARRRKGQKKR